MSKLWVIVLGAAVTAVVAAGLYLNMNGTDAAISPAMANDPDALVVEVAANEHIMGNPDAPVTIVEYASLTCPHCAAFHTDTLPEVKKQLLDTGKARLVFRDFPLDQLALRAAGLVRCAQPLQRPAVLKLLFQTQQTWARSQDPLGALDQIGRAVGMSEAVTKACFQDQAILDAVIAQRLEAEQKYKVASTPSFIIGGKLYGGGLSVDQIVELVAAATP
jgi:protein-disulfide isomerase